MGFLRTLAPPHGAQAHRLGNTVLFLSSYLSFQLSSKYGFQLTKSHILLFPNHLHDFHIPLCFTHCGTTIITVQRKKATAAAVPHRDLLALCSSVPVMGRFCQVIRHFPLTSRTDRVFHSLVDEAVTLTWVWMTCLLCTLEKVQVYVPECFSMSGLCSRSEPSPR